MAAASRLTSCSAAASFFNKPHSTRFDFVEAAFVSNGNGPSGGELLAGSFLKRREAEEQRESILIDSLCSSLPLRFKKESADPPNRRPLFANHFVRRRNEKWCVQR